MIIGMKRALDSVGLAAAALILTSISQHAAAQTGWPERPVTMVVPFAAGGGTDVLGRIVGKGLGEVLGQQVIIENVAGAGGMVGSARVVKAPPDGYQFVLGSRADAINQTLYKNPLYNFAADLAPVVLIADQPTLLVARKDLICKSSSPMRRRTSRGCKWLRRERGPPAISTACCSTRRSGSTSPTFHTAGEARRCRI